MRRPLPNYFTSSMSVQQVLDAVNESLANYSPELAPDRSVPTTAEELSDELRVWLADAIRFHAEAPERGWGAKAIADLAAGLRDRERMRDGDYRGISHHAGLIGHWLVARTEQPTVGESLEVARLAADGEPEDSDLALDLADLIRGRADGSIDGEQFGRILKKPTRGGRAPQPPPRPPATVPPGSITVRGARETLQQMLGPLGANAGFAEVWEAFKRFAAQPIFGEPPEQMNEHDELMLFECGPRPGSAELAGAGSYAGLLRQMPVEDEDGDPDRLEELRCEVLFASAQVRFDDHQAIWSDGNLEVWFTKVEASEAFKALIATGSPTSISVEQSWR